MPARWLGLLLLAGLVLNVAGCSGDAEKEINKGKDKPKPAETK